jgi:dihydroxyacetone kinase
MADDDIERLLREVNAMNADGSSTPERSSASKTPAKKDDSSGGGAGGRLAFAAGSGVVVGAVGAIVGQVLFILPAIGPITTGVGAAFGGFVTALVAGPPRWFSS